MIQKDECITVITLMILTVDLEVNFWKSDFWMKLLQHVSSDECNEMGRKGKMVRLILVVNSSARLLLTSP